MAKIFLLSQSDIFEKEDLNVKNLLLDNDFELQCSNGEIQDILTQLHHFCPDVILLDNCVQNCEFLIRQIKSNAKNENAQIILILNNKDYSKEYIKLVDGFIIPPFTKEILLATINSHSKIKKSLNRLYENNKELSRSLYQLNVLYNTSSGFAGTLNTSKLYDIMTEAMEKTLSFDVSCVLILNSLGKPIINLNSIHNVNQNLKEALKIRSILNYKTLSNDNFAFLNDDFENIELSLKVKQERSNKIHGLEVINYDSLFAPIKVGDDFFGVVELFRQTPYSHEDVTCFQAITHQVALPLRSAKLYEEISRTNIKLEKLEKLKSEFVSIVSHELRTPLTPINNSLEIVLSNQAGEISPDARNFISMAKRNIQRLSGIIEDLLDLSRIQAGKLDFKYKLVDISSSLELLQKTFLQIATQKNISINLSIKEKLPEIYVDLRRVEQIFTNLVSNALKFTPQDGLINVDVSIISTQDIPQNLIDPIEKPCGKYIKVSVKDNGIGIKKEDIPKIFDKFSQIESSLNRNKGGVGLGLTITKQLIDSHLGAIWVDSEENKGSVFNVILPLFDETKAFKMDLSHTLINHEDVGVIKLEFNSNVNLIEKLKENKLLNLIKLSKELYVNQENKTKYYVFIPKISSSSFEAVCKSIYDYSLKEDSDIILSKVHTSKDCIDPYRIIEILNS